MTGEDGGEVLGGVASTGRNRPHRRRLGLWAPNETIEAAEGEAAEAEAAATEEQRSKHREHSARSRAKQKAAYRDEFEDVIRRWSSPLWPDMRMRSAPR